MSNRRSQSTIRDRIEYTGTGFPVVLRSFPAYKDGATYFPDVGPMGLHRAVAVALLRRQGPLAGRELRFLRTHLDLSRGECARRLAVSRQTLIRWESAGAKALPTAARNHVAIKLILARQLSPEPHLPDTALRASSRQVRKKLELHFGPVENALTVLGATYLPVQVQTYLHGQRQDRRAA